MPNSASGPPLYAHEAVFLMQSGFSFEDVAFRYRRGGASIIDGLTWMVPEGRTVLLGPNGAGKTTLLALGAGALTPRHGRVCWGEVDSGRRGDRSVFRRAVGYMPQQVQAVPGLTCREQVAYAAWLKGMSTRAAWDAAGLALEPVGLTDLADRSTSELSGGQLRRVGLAQTLVHDAQVILLDEPTVGLDPAQRARFREALAALPGSPVLVVSTHQVDDLSELYATVVVIHAGRLRFEGPVSKFMSLAPPGSERPAESAYLSIVSSEG